MREETLRERIATIVQSGFIAKKTSDEIAGDIEPLVIEHTGETIERVILGDGP